VQIIREKHADDGEEETPRVRPTKVVKASQFTSHKKIETEEDLEEYLDGIRQQLKKLLDENKITVI
jgi:uncharacterized protein YnzC (UPF0291/DUF896 family)